MASWLPLVAVAVAAAVAAVAVVGGADTPLVPYAAPTTWQGQ